MFLFVCVCALACALVLSLRIFAIGHLGHWSIWGSSSWTRPAHISAVAMEIAPGLEMKAPSAIHRVDEQLFRLEGCRKTPALMCSWRGPSLHAQGFPSQKHSNALKKVKSWRGLAKGQSLFWNRSEHQKPKFFLDSRTRLNFCILTPIPKFANPL